MNIRVKDLAQRTPGEHYDVITEDVLSSAALFGLKFERLRPIFFLLRIR